MKNDLFKNLASKLGYLSESDLLKIKKAYIFAEKIHEGQKRLSGDDFITHPLAVAHYLANYKYDADLISAGLLHDILEESPVSQDVLKNNFDYSVIKIVMAVTSISKVPLKDKALIFSDEDMYLERVEEYRKLLVAMAREIRVMVVKLADRLHNIQTIQFLPKHKQPFYARETIEIYAQIADRLGLSLLKAELEDLSFPFAYAKEYKSFQNIINNNKDIKPELIDQKISEIKRLLSNNNILFQKIYGRIKHDFSLYRKLKFDNKNNLDNIYDLHALRIVTNDIESCYKILGLIHTIYSPLPGRIYDFIAEPKPNGYQSIHSTVRDNTGNIFEIQIRTQEMHQIADSGIAAHWLYKTEINQKATHRLKQSYEDWIVEVEKLNRIKNKKKILSYLKEDLFADKIFVFTPNREIIKLPKGSTPIDFAFRIHSSLGLKISGAKVNGRLISINNQLQNGDEVEILTKNSANPSIDWLRFCKTSSAKQKIRQYLRSKNRHQYVSIGRQLLNQFLLKHDLQLPTQKIVDDAISESRLPYQSFEDALIGLSEKAIRVNSLAKIIFPNLSFSEKRNPQFAKTLSPKSKLSGIKNIYAGCCKPKKDDKLIAYVGQDHLIKIHKVNCGMIKNVNPERLICL